MKKGTFILIFISLFFFVAVTGQVISEFDSKVKISKLVKDNNSDSLVVKLPDGTLGLRDANTVSHFQILSISNDTIFLENGGFIKLPTGFDGEFSSLSGIPSGLADGDDNTQLSDIDITAFGYIKSSNDADSNPTNEIQNLLDVLMQSNDGGAEQIKNIADPTDAQDAVTLSFLEDRIFELEFAIGKDSVADFEGNYYNYSKIGNQWWLTENLRSTKYNDGTSIPKVEDDVMWSNLTSPAYCWYDNDSATNFIPYGALYNFAVVDTSNHRNICPSGWHVPSEDDWDELVAFLGVSAGGKMKDTIIWLAPNTGATNESGFSGLPGGSRDATNMIFRNNYSTGLPWAAFWSTTSPHPQSPQTKRIMMLFYNSASAYAPGNGAVSQDGISIRCLRDE